MRRSESGVLTALLAGAVVLVLLCGSYPASVHGFTTSSGIRSAEAAVSGSASNNSTPTFVAYGALPGSPSGVPLPTGGWPTYEYGTNRSGHSTTEQTLSAANASNLQLEWNITLPGPVYASPTEVNGTVFVGCWNGYEYAVNATDGVIDWTFLGVENFSNGSEGYYWLNPLGVTSSAAVYGNVVYVGAYTNYTALNAATGAIIWSTPVGQAPSGGGGLLGAGYYSWSSPTLYRGNLYVGLSSQIDHPFPPGGIWELSASTGAVVHKWWSGSTSNLPTDGASVWSTPTIDAPNNTLFVTTGNAAGSPQNAPYAESIIALNATTLTLQGAWTVPSPGNLDSDFGAGGTLFSSGTGTHYIVATNKNGNAYAVDGTKLYTGPKWTDTMTVYPGQTTCSTFQAPGDSIAPGAFDGNSVYLGGLFTTTTRNGPVVNGTVRSVNPATGAYNWQAVTPGGVSSGIASADGVVVAASRFVHSLGPTNGCYKFFGTNASWLQVFNSTNGNQLYRYFFGYPVVSAPTIADGRIFVGATINNTTNWTLEQNHLGHLYAFGLPLAAPTQVRPEVTFSGYYGVEIGGVLAYGNASGGMPAYGQLGWVWGDGTSLGGHGGVHYYYPQGGFAVSFSLVDATDSRANALYKVYTGYSLCGTPPFQYVCAVVSVVHCYNYLSCFAGVILPTVFTGGIHGVTIASWSWNFGDGSGLSTLQSPSHTYAAHGNYLVTETMTDAEGHQYLQTLEVTV